MSGIEKYHQHVRGVYENYVPPMYHVAAKDIDELIRLLAVALERAKPELKVVPYRNEFHLGKLKDVTGDKTIEFKGEVPEYVIAWRLLKQAPARRGTEPSHGIAERKPVYRDVVSGENGLQLRYGWYIDSYVGFQLLAKSTKEQAEFRRWFRKQMVSLTPALKFLGAERLYWLGLGSLGELPYNRPLNELPEDIYFFRTEDVYIVEESYIRYLSVDLNMGLEDKEEYDLFIDRIIDDIKRGMKSQK